MGCLDFARYDLIRLRVVLWGNQLRARTNANRAGKVVLYEFLPGRGFCKQNEQIFGAVSAALRDSIGVRKFLRTQRHPAGQ